MSNDLQIEFFPALAHGRVVGGDWPLATHLVTPRKGFLHHGLYAGNGRVIHYAGLAGGLSRRTVEEVSIEQFARGRAVYVHSESGPFDHTEVIRRARSRLGENHYRVLSNNCEHFCEWCLHGIDRSTQVEALRHRPIARSAAWCLDLHFGASEALRQFVYLVQQRLFRAYSTEILDPGCE